MAKIFSIFDSKVNAYAIPFSAPNASAAIRMVAAATMDSESDLFKFGADFTLFEIGEFNEETGFIVPLDAFNNLGTALLIMSDAQECHKSQIRRSAYAAKKEIKIVPETS